MLAVPHVRAQTFMQKMLNGRTNPSLFTCRNCDGQCQDYVVKPCGQLGSNIICEFLAALVGRYLGLPIPQIAIVEIDPHLIDVIPCSEAHRLLAGDDGPHFGSLHRTGGFAPLPVGFSVSEALFPQVLDIFAFDMLIQNPDRSNVPGHGKPNLLCNGQEFIIFDHELAFSFVAAIGTTPLPWELRDLPFVRHHVFYNHLVRHARNHDLSFDTFLSRIMDLSDPVLAEMIDAIPDNWRNLTKSGKIISHLGTARDHIKRFERGLLEALA